MTPGTLFAATYDYDSDMPVMHVSLAFTRLTAVNPQMALSAKCRVFHRSVYPEAAASRETIAQLEYEDSITDDSVCYDYILWEK